MIHQKEDFKKLKIFLSFTGSFMLIYAIIAHDMYVQLYTEIESFKQFTILNAFTLSPQFDSHLTSKGRQGRVCEVVSARGSCPFYTFTAVINFLWRMGNLGVNKALLSNNLLRRHKPIIVSLGRDSNPTQIFSKYLLGESIVSGHLADRWICVTISSMSG